jgi:circadian clock protein KaiC
MLITEIPIGSNNIGSGMEEFVADGIIQLEHGKTNAIPATVKVIKMRTTSINRESHVSLIGKKGMVVYPKQSLKSIIPTSMSRVKTGVPGLDARVGGGFFEGTATILAGASGSGKTTFGFQFLLQRTLDGKKCIFCSLEDTPDEIRIVSKSLGFDIDNLEKKGLHLLSWTPENQSPDAFISELTAKIEAIKPEFLVIDGISSFQHLYGRDMYSIVKRLVNLTQRHGLTSIFTFLSDQVEGAIVSSHGIFSIFQNILLLRYVEVEGQLMRSMLILKMRASRHDQSIFQIAIENKVGVKITGDIKNFEGILTGVAKRVYEKFLKDEKIITDKETKSKQRRRAKLDTRQKKIAQKTKRERVHRKRKNIGV